MAFGNPSLHSQDSELGHSAWSLLHIWVCVHRCVHLCVQIRERGLDAGRCVSWERGSREALRARERNRSSRRWRPALLFQGLLHLIIHPSALPSPIHPSIHLSIQVYLLCVSHRVLWLYPLEMILHLSGCVSSQCLWLDLSFDSTEWIQVWSSSLLSDPSSYSVQLCFTEILICPHMTEISNQFLFFLLWFWLLLWKYIVSHFLIQLLLTP